jgi:hypothetical protein
MTLLESSPAASALLQLVAAELRRNKRKGLCFPISHGLLWWSSTTTTDHRADAAELHRICPRSALAVLPQLYANCGGAPPQFAAVLSNPCC